MKFIVDENVGKLARWLRMTGFDTLGFNGENDSEMIAIALAQGRVLLTRDTEILKRRLVTGGRLKAILIESEEPEQQMRQVMEALKLKNEFRPFTLCLEDNHALVACTPKEVEGRVPPFVFQTQKEYMECPSCHRIYWKGTHWLAMTRKLEKILRD